MMRLLYWGGLVAAATALLTSCRTDVKVAEKEQDLVIDGSVQAKLAPLLKDYAPAKPLRSTDELREIDNKGNLGRLIYYERKVAYAPLESGLWGIHGIGGFTSNDSRGSSSPSSTTCSISPRSRRVGSTSGWSRSTPPPSSARPACS